jgi:hypothetical protein
MMNSKWAVARGLLTFALLGGCVSHPQLREEPARPEPLAAKTTSAPLSAPAPAPASPHPMTEGRLINSGLIIQTFADKFRAGDLQQVPSEFIDTGTFRRVPYLSYEAAQFELNIYGDPQHPAGVEIGVYAGKDGTKEELRNLMARLLQQAADRELVHGLALNQDQLERAGLTFEITPPTADDAFGGWWISIYDKTAIDKARASDAELERLVVRAPAPSAESETRRAKKKSKKHADRKAKLPDVYVEDYAKENGVYIHPAL